MTYVQYGHPRITFLGDSLLSFSANERSRGFHEADPQAGIPVDPDLVIHVDGALESARPAALGFLISNRYICCSELLNGGRC